MMNKRRRKKSYGKSNARRVVDMSWHPEGAAFVEALFQDWPCDPVVNTMTADEAMDLTPDKNAQL